MSLHKFAEQVAAHGRGDDSLLVHMTPDEVQRLQAFAEANGTTMTINPDTGLVEIVELENHPFFIGVQYHPEYKSTVETPHPLFVSFVAATVNAKKK